MTDLDERITTTIGSAVVDRCQLDGGQVGSVHRVELADGRVIVAKTGETPLSVEGRMLEYLADHSELPVPTVYAASDDLLLIEHIEGKGAITPAVERDLADRLAALHAVSADAYGFPFDTLSGTLTQPNPWMESWITFYREQRLGHVIEIARSDGCLPDSVDERLTAVLADLESLLVEPETPALVHGDIWRQNLLIDGDHERIAGVIDPAIYHGHAEIELAYIRWTDTAGAAFFDRYREHRTIEEGFHERRYHVYTLYPLVEHVWYFGSEYLDELRDRLTELGY
ncbi:MAG: fructosamine kinase family protein [Halobacteriales archaeon]|nr:fructosamine kinase family protein [Halobacteriales archaeon]